MRNDAIENAKRGLQAGRVLIKIGGDEEDRTPGLGIANAALSQLSYIPERIDSLELKAESFKQNLISELII